MYGLQKRLDWVIQWDDVISSKNGILNLTVFKISRFAIVWTSEYRLIFYHLLNQFCWNLIITKWFTSYQLFIKRLNPKHNSFMEKDVYMLIVRRLRSYCAPFLGNWQCGSAQIRKKIRWHIPHIFKHVNAQRHNNKWFWKYWNSYKFVHDFF
jgi:hypothetical protein